MFRAGPRISLQSTARPISFARARTVGGRRFISTNPPHLKSRTWKSSALRWGIAAAGIYYYNTSPVFAEQPQYNLLNPNVDALDTDDSPTLEALTASSRKKNAKDASVLQSAIEVTSADDAANSVAQPATDLGVTDASPAELEEEAEGQGAFNPVTGEINWDCPCLGGMAYGPCGPEFKEAFSCFVYSTEEPKGMECIDKFQNMQNCFRAHPEHYQAELDDDEEMDAELAQEKEELTKKIAERKAADKAATSQESGARLLEEPTPTPAPKKKTSSRPKSNKPQAEKSSATVPAQAQDQPQAPAKVAASSEPHSGMSEEHEMVNEGQTSRLHAERNNQSFDSSSVVEDSLVPKAAHDARDTATKDAKASA